MVGGAWNVARTRATHEKEAHKKDGTLTFDDLWRHFFGHDFSHAMGWAWTHTLHITHYTLHITHLMSTGLTFLRMSSWVMSSHRERAMGWAWSHTSHITHYTFDEYGTHIFGEACAWSRLHCRHVSCHLLQFFGLAQEPRSTHVRRQNS